MTTKTPLSALIAALTLTTTATGVASAMDAPSAPPVVTETVVKTVYTDPAQPTQPIVVSPNSQGVMVPNAQATGVTEPVPIPPMQHPDYAAAIFHNGDPTKIDQGDSIVFSGVSSSTVCTVGYVDKKAHQIITARHCVYGEHGTTPLYPLAKDDTGAVVGVGGIITGPDAIRVTIPASKVGSNIFSGDTVTHSLKPGDRVCSVGAKSRTIRCDSAQSIDKTDGTVVTGGGMGGTHGDSGGPVWREDGSGFAGIYTGILINSNTRDVIGAKFSTSH